MAVPALADRIADAYVRVQLLHAARTPSRLTTEVAGLPIAVLGLAQPWGTSVLALRERPQPAALARALAWCAARSPAYSVLLRARDEELGSVLPHRDELPAFVLPLVHPPATAPVAGVAVGPAGSAGEFAGVYRAAFAMPPGMAEALVDDADLAAPGLVHLVARRSGRAVGCVMLRLAAGVGYVSALGTLPDERGRGIGTLLTRAACAQARSQGADLALLHAAPGRSSLYEGMGFERVDTHVSRGTSA